MTWNIQMQKQMRTVAPLSEAIAIYCAVISCADPCDLKILSNCVAMQRQLRLSLWRVMLIMMSSGAKLSLSVTNTVDKS